MTDEREFQTTNINLAAALLTRLSSGRLVRIDVWPSVDGKRLIHLRFPATQENTAHQIIESFLQRDLSLNLYGFNRNLNLLRDYLHGKKQDYAP